MGVEFGKKENRSEPGFSTTMAEFLDVSVTLREPSYTCHVWWLQVHGLGGTHIWGYPFHGSGGTYGLRVSMAWGTNSLGVPLAWVWRYPWPGGHSS